MTGQSLSVGLKHVRLRSFVLVRILAWLWEFRRDVFPAAGSNLCTMVGYLAAAVNEETDVVSVERLWKERVEKQLPKTEGDVPENERRGQVPEVFKQILFPGVNGRGDAESMLPQEGMRFITKAKNATPGDALEASVEAAMTNSDPRCFIFGECLVYACSRRILAQLWFVAPRTLRLRRLRPMQWDQKT